MRSSCFTKRRRCLPSNWHPCSQRTRSIRRCSCCRRGRPSMPTTRNATSPLLMRLTSTRGSYTGTVRAAMCSMKCHAFRLRSEPSMSCARSRRAPDLLTRTGRRRVHTGWPAGLLALFFASTALAASVQLRPEDPARLHVGDVAVVRVASAPHYFVGSAGTALMLLKRTEERGITVYRYRAVAPGNQTLVLTPRDPGPDGCISCVTVHYFITVAR